MTIKHFIIPLLASSVLLLLMLLCYAPAKNHLRYKRSHTIVAMSAATVFLATITVLSTLVYSRDFGMVNVLSIVLLFLLYHRSLTLPISQTLSIFLLVCAFATFLVNFSIIFDAILHPNGMLINFSLEAFLFLLGLCLFFGGICLIPLAKYGSYILDHIQLSKVWWLFSLVSAVFYFYNLRMTVHYYSTLHTNKVGMAYIFGMITMFVLLLLLCIIFYLIVNTLIRKAEADDRNRILEMQEKQYESLQRYIHEDAKVRHDFRQTIYALTELSSEKNYQAIDEYLRHYKESIPQKEMVDFCDNQPLNALFNHYYRKAETANIKAELKIAIPDTLNIDTIDLCSIVGNILENAITACGDIPEKDRFIRLIISEEQNRELYIALSNSFNGTVRQIKDRYLSTHKGGNGIGLLSVATTAAQYNGTAEFFHDNCVFYSNIMLRNSSR